MSNSERYGVQMYRIRLQRTRKLRYSVADCSSPSHAAAILRSELRDADREHLIVIALDGRCMPIAVETAAIGGLHGCSIAPRDVLKLAILTNASAIIVGHSHSSGDPRPSEQDIVFTQALERACEAIGTPLMDHVIVTPSGEHTSMHELGLLTDDATSPALRLARSVRP